MGVDWACGTHGKLDGDLVGYVYIYIYIHIRTYIYSSIEISFLVATIGNMRWVCLKMGDQLPETHWIFKDTLVVDR